jgi:hypothetical protein
MEFSDLVELVKDQPLFDSGLLLSGDVSPGYIRRQLSSWIDAGKIIQLRRGLYVLASPFQKTSPHPFQVANCFKQPSYVSYQSALAYYGLIPEGVYTTVSATTRRPGKWVTALGTFQYHHVLPNWFSDYISLDLGGQQSAFIASPEKALLDLVFLTSQGDSPSFLDELRLQNLEGIDLSKMEVIVKRAGKPKLARFFVHFQQLVQQQAKGNRRL